MPMIIDSLREDDRNTERLLTILEQEAAAFEFCKRPDYDVLSGIIEYFRSYPTHCHKPKQELLFAKLKARAPECTAGMIRMQADRGQALQQFEKIAKLVTAVFGEQEIPRHSFNAAVAEFVAHVRGHVELDQQKLYPAALEKLTSQDWAELDGKLADPERPPLNRDVETRCVRLSESIISWELEDQAERAWFSQGR
jgi:hemerythrin-like domain-containing protein